AAAPGERLLLHGVTGSGKTEVYLRAAAATLERGEGVIVLVPEIALTPQIVARFAERFGDTVAVLHSKLSAGERHDEWSRLRRGARRLLQARRRPPVRRPPGRRTARRRGRRRPRRRKRHAAARELPRAAPAPAPGARGRRVTSAGGGRRYARGAARDPPAD